MLETNALHYRVASYLYSSSSIHSTRLPQNFHHLHQLNKYSSHTSTLVPCIKPSVYRVTCFADDRQSCYYSNDYRTVALDPLVPHRKRSLPKRFCSAISESKISYSQRRKYRRCDE